MGSIFETFFEMLGFVFACFFKRPPEQHFIDLYSICGTFLKLFSRFPEQGCYSDFCNLSNVSSSFSRFRGFRIRVILACGFRDPARSQFSRFVYVFLGRRAVRLEPVACLLSLLNLTPERGHAGVCKCVREEWPEGGGALQ